MRRQNLHILGGIMKDKSSRRDFLALGLALPATALGSTPLPGLSGAEAPLPAVQAAGGLSYRVLGKTGLKVTTVGFGCMITSDPSVLEKAADLENNYFDTAREYQSGNNERMVGAALKAKRNNLYISTKSGGGTKQEALDHLE